MQHEDYVKTQWWLHNLLVTDRKIVGSSTRDDENSHGSIAKRAEENIAIACATGLVPFRFLNNLAFRKFVHCVQQLPDPFTIPSPSKIRRLIGSLSSDHFLNLKTALRDVKKFTVVTDGFSDLRRDFHFYSLHVSFVDKDFERKLFFCGVQGTKGGDFASIGDALCVLLEKINKKFSDCSAITCDGASSLVLLANTHQVDRVHCCCHIINLVITDFLKNRTVKNIQTRLQNFATHLVRNKSDRESLKAMSNSNAISSPLPLPLPDTRWTGLYSLLKLYVIHYPSAKSLSCLQKYLVKQDEMAKIEELRDLLKPLNDSILKMERDSSLSSEIIPVLKFIQSTVVKSKSMFAETLKVSIEKRLRESLQNDRLLCTMLLDNRYAYVDRMISPKSWEYVEACLEEYEEIENSVVTRSPSDSPMNEDIDSFLCCSVSNDEETTKTIKSEILRYKSLILTTRPNFDNPLLFWKGNANNFPKLTSIAIELFGTPASSASSERLFSRCTDIMRQTKRSRVTIQTLNDLITMAELSRLKKRREVQLLINKYASETEEQTENPLAIIRKPRRISFVDEISTPTPLACSENFHHEPLLATRRASFNWEQCSWPKMEGFYQQMSLAMGSLTNGELAFAMCNPTKQIKFDIRDIEKQRELEEELRDWLPKVGSHILESKNSFEKYYGTSSTSIKPIIRNKENIVWGPAYRHLDVKTLRTVMEHELAELGMSRLQKMMCNSCAHYYPANLLYLVKKENGEKEEESPEQSISKCISCWETWKLPLPSKTVFDFLIVGIAEKWAELVGRRVQYLYGQWDDRITGMVRMLKENVLLAEDIATLLKTCNDPEEFMDACEVVICTTMVFYLEYVDFRRSCEALIKLKPNVTFNQLFEIFAIYFPNRAKGVKTGDFL